MNDLVIYPEQPQGLYLTPIQSIEQAIELKKAFDKFVSGVLVDGSDFGQVGGTSRPTLLQPGAQKLAKFYALTHNLVELARVEDWNGAQYGEPFFLYRYRCVLYRGGIEVGDGIGSCNSWESKYRWRNAERKCPSCGAPAIRKDRQKNSFYCWTKQNGCGAQFAGDDQRIINQTIGKIPNPDVYDQVNTFDKMAQKRAFVAAVLNVTGASDYFTQDMEDTHGGDDDDAASATVQQNTNHAGGSTGASAKRSQSADNRTQQQQSAGTGQQQSAANNSAARTTQAGSVDTNGGGEAKLADSVSRVEPAGGVAKKEAAPPELKAAYAEFCKTAGYFSIDFAAMSVADRKTWLANLLNCEPASIKFGEIDIPTWSKLRKALDYYLTKVIGEPEWLTDERIVPMARKVLNDSTIESLYDLTYDDWMTIAGAVNGWIMAAKAPPIFTPDDAQPSLDIAPADQYEPNPRGRFFAMAAERGFRWSGTPEQDIARRQFVGKLLNKEVKSCSTLTDTDWNTACHNLRLMDNDVQNAPMPTAA